MDANALFIGSIVCTVPEYGVALVTSSEGTATSRELFIATLPYQDAWNGVVNRPSYADGMSVLCVRNPNVSIRAFIVAPVNWNENDIYDASKQRALYNLDAIKSSNDPIFQNVLDQYLSLYKKPYDNQGHSVDIDALPGDYDISDRDGLTGIHIGRLLTNIRGSALAYEDASNITNIIRHVGDRIENHTLTGMDIKSDVLNVSDTAISPSEGFGVAAGPVIKVNETEDTVALINDAAAPLYRLQNVAGAVADGDERLVLAFPDAPIHTSETEPPILAKERRSLSGEFVQASTLGVASIKTPGILGIHQLGYKQKDQDDLLTPFEYEQQEQPKEKEVDPSLQISDAAINKILDRLLTGDYLEALKAKMAEKGLIVATKEGTLQAQFKEATTPAGATDAQEYPLPPAIELTDPVTGRKQQYYATSSFITQESDGSILICDGYGSEIRMSRGNIYISPALDLIFRPGRDLYGMTPRHQSFNAQGTCTINSAESMYIRAVKDLKMAGSTGGRGVVVLESDAVSGGDVPGGMVIRSKSNMAIAGQNILIARNNNQQATKKQMVASQNAGVIIIEGGDNGAVYTHCKSSLLDAVSIVHGSFDGASNSAFIINQGMIGLYTQTVLMPANLGMIPINGSETITVPRAGGTRQITLTTSTEPDLLVAGSGQFGGYLCTNGQGLFCGGLAARGISSTASTNGVIRNPDMVFKPYEFKPQRAVNAFGADTTAMVEAASTGVYQDFYIVGNEFAFPTVYAGVTTALRMPGMVWQVKAKEAGVQYIWKEQYMTQTDGTYTACYPGYNMWETSTISKPGYEQEALKTSYTINTKGVTNGN